jgi:enterochelin esterase-like enzyme
MDGAGFYRDYLGGETEIQPYAGKKETLPDTILAWKEAEAGPNGYVDLREAVSKGTGVTYAYTTLQSDAGGQAVFLVGGNGGLQVWINGKLVHHNRLYRKPRPGDDVFVAELQPGANRLLVKVEGRGPRWGFFLERYGASGRLFVNQRNLVLPDLRVGSQLGAWGQVEVTHVADPDGDAPLFSAVVEVIGNDLFTASRSSAVQIPPGETRRIPVWIATRKPVTEADTLAVEFRVSTDGSEVTFRARPLLRSRDGYFVTTYRSGVDGSVQPFSVLLPASYDSRYAYPLILLLHGAWVTDWGQNIISYRRKEWAIQVAVHDRGNNRYTEIGQVDLFEVLQEIKRRYHIDEDRIYLSGHSMGGYGAWFHGTRHPDLWAAISPQAGYADYFLYHPAMRRGRAVPPFRRKLLTEASPLLFAENLLHVPAYVIHGALDENVSVEHARRMTARLKQLGYRFIYDENPEGGHWWGPRGKYYGTEVVDKPPIYEFFQQFRRNRSPKTIRYRTTSLRYNRAYWVSIDEMDTVYAMAEIRALVTGTNRIDLQSKNITQFTLDLKVSPIDLDEVLTVTVNDRTVYSAPPPRSGRLTLRRHDQGRFVQSLTPEDAAITGSVDAESDAVAAVLNDGRVERYLPVRKANLLKTPTLFGPISDAFNSPFLFVVGASGDSEEWVKANRQAARWATVDWQSRANGRVSVKTDDQVTPQDLQDFNLVLFGDPSSNQWIERINSYLPIRFEDGRIVANDRPVGGEDAGLLMIYPNPISPGKYVVVVGGTTPEAVRLAHRVGFTSLPDFVVFDRQSLDRGESAYPLAGFFDKYWNLPAVR